MDFDHAAATLPLLLAVFGALITVYPVSERHQLLRHWLATGFMVLGIGAAVLTWAAVDSSQKFQNDVMTSLTGGDNFALVWPLRVMDHLDADFPVVLYNLKDTPLFEVDVTVIGPLAQEQKTHFNKITETFSKTDITLGNGKYIAFVAEKNGSVVEHITINKLKTDCPVSISASWFEANSYRETMRYIGPDYCRVPEFRMPACTEMDIT